MFMYLLLVCCWFFFFKQKTAYEMRISDWSSDVCSSDLVFWHFSRSCRSGAKSRGSATCGGTSMTVTFELRSCDVPPPSNQIGELRCGAAVSARVQIGRAHV